jgi:microcystin-dependent protein
MRQTFRKCTIAAPAGRFTANRVSSLLLVCLLFLHTAFSQVGIGVSTPDVHSMLDIQSTTKGVLIPRLTPAQMTALAATLTAGEAGMLVTDASTGKLTGWNGQVWTDAANLSAASPLSVGATNQISINPGTSTGDLITWDGNNWINMQPAVQHFSFNNVENRQSYLVLNYCIAMNGIFPARNDATPFVSQIQLFPFNFAPTGWALCNGQILAISQNTALFALVGTQFGGNGTSNFALPNLQSRIAVGMGQGPGLSPYNIGDSGGVESNTISK